MIKYALVCDNAHGFESWFPDSDAYDAQAKRGFLACPDCGSAKIGKAIMSPSVARKDQPRAATPDVELPSATPVAVPQPVTLLDERQQALRSMLRELRGKILETSVDVGPRFSQEARRMHDGDVPQRSIRGEASLEDARSLWEDGIEIMPIPRLPEEWN